MPTSTKWICATLAIASIVFGGCQQAKNENPRIPEKEGPAVEADHPVPFGYKCAWLAIRSDNPDAVVASLGLSGVRNRKFPNEQDVMNLAAAWSIDPITIDQQKLDKSVGHVGSLDKK